MADVNIVVLLGRLTRDPELRYTPGGTAVATLGVAVNNRVKQGEEWKDEPCFVDVTVFGRQAETSSEYLSKGSQVIIEGRLSYHKWEKDGQTRSKLEVKATNVRFVGPGKGGAKGGPAQGGDFEGAPDLGEAPF
jgi:single-strand DNA-binding protein